MKYTVKINYRNTHRRDATAQHNLWPKKPGAHKPKTRSHKPPSTWNRSASAYGHRKSAHAKIPQRTPYGHHYFYAHPKYHPQKQGTPTNFKQAHRQHQHSFNKSTPTTRQYPFTSPYLFPQGTRSSNSNTLPSNTTSCTL